uniref:Large ribosomal subunit protein uL5c n=1 Tax=Compsopogon caeruleus TaxID=31354 RepID=A0A1Z1XB60_9RHOD|nr:50S ribosomal protein L5 [Compsopogon caeruleus]ARX96089.1 50S ribosomal protein L5 [Compsopogon caeruleus]
MDQTTLYTVYKEQVNKSLMEKFQYKNIHQIPKLVKVTLNRGLGEASQNAKILEKSVLEFSLITGQAPMITKAKKSIAGFKIREDLPIGLMVTLRKYRMYTFLNKFINLSLPRIRDFRGVDVKGFDGRGNFNIGLKEQLLFPEIQYDQVDKIDGLDISVVTTAKTDQECFMLLKALGMPFKDTLI